MRPLTIAGALLILAACTDPTTMTGVPDATMAPGGLSANVVSESSTDLWERIITGETGPGSLYQLYLPREWNGTAVFYAHGIRDVLEPVSLRDQDNLGAIRDQLGQRGIAVAYSSYSENGYAEKDGVQRTHQLRGQFTSQFGTPARSLIVGHSLGGLVALNVAEKFADQYDGAAAFCGVVGGTQAEFNHMVTTRLLFDLFYPRHPSRNVRSDSARTHHRSGKAGADRGRDHGQPARPSGNREYRAGEPSVPARVATDAAADGDVAHHGAQLPRPRRG